mmetsp:Transcript_19741/g.42338  ORF Transcript_19741/g.42338 Transcript_19741/m.42338 type:complete len:564 (+) Transcript_19741:170-1861(+)|eukprot:CAMPEP_0172525480 /NCGR_PEP_ID=MMETSP1067-20121228/514_1 /TAXON_ID=265564 ORGANISM="Thalassiosira punctigera, Strain Tpunct2005C2" /NCGR_SAMPLE_ID=MMETSP1067 /ASSEMBLY_ACC=CAM_ASM_000444 /LENGTH=563 /DNA_ID=CAMNT_0013308749 /DNA_START=170 /DNA_END=1861 /DNA_ORIENTATION=-
MKGIPSSLPALLLAAASAPASVTLAEFRRFEGPIDAASNYIHYSEGYVVTPGYVDISDLVFESADDGGTPGEYVAEERDWDDDDGEEETGEDDGEGGRRDRRLGEDGDEVDAALASGSTYVDIVLFHEPAECANTRLGCDWTELGVGANDGVGNLRWCCSDDAAALGLCRGGPKQEGRLIVDPDKFEGQHRFLGVPPSGTWRRNVKEGMFDLKTLTAHRGEGAGKYVLVVSNCNDQVGRNLTVSGEYVWKSSHGYLPGNLFGEMYFFCFLTVCYAVLLACYGLKMSIHRDEIIPIQKWVLATIGIGLLEVFFKGGDLWVWNIDGDRFWFSLYTGVIVGVLKRAVSRCLVVMLCLGWGVTCDDLGDKMKRIVTLGVAYAGSSAARDVMTVLAITENEVLSTETETEILDVVAILTFVTAFVDVIFYWWIFDALNGTMQYLEGMSQSRKLQRYLRLRLILLLSILFAVVWTVFGIVDSYNDKRIINEEENGWVLNAVWEFNYLMILVGLSWLWGPEAGAKEYAYVMELSTIGNDLEFDTNVVDSPESDDEDADDGEYGVNKAVKA